MSERGSQEWKDKVSRGKNGSVAWNKGTAKFTEKACLNCNQTFKYRACIRRSYCSRYCYGKAHRSEKNYRWIKDRTKLCRISKQGERRSSAYFEWRKQVWLRDNYKCKISNKECSALIEAHHILGWKEYPELRFITNNGITLCRAHHPRKKSEEKRLSPYFQGLVSVSKG